jgi:hypothetical protein
MSTGEGAKQSGELRRTPSAKLVHNNNIEAFSGPWGLGACFWESQHRSYPMLVL